MPNDGTSRQATAATGTGQQHDGTSGTWRQAPTPIQAFWPQDPALWFLALETRWSRRPTLSDDDKADCVLDRLSFEQTQEIADVLRDPHPGNRYVQIKNSLIDRYTASQANRTKRLLEGETIGDRKPSQFLRHLRNVGGSAANNEILSMLVMRQLPPATQAVLSIMDHKTPEQLASAADKAFEITAQSAYCASVEASPTTPVMQQLLNKMEQMQTKIDALSQRVDVLARQQDHGRHRSRQHSAMRSRPRLPTPSGESSRSRLCYFHSKFGERAYRCNQPCSFTKSGNDSVSP